VPNDGFRLRPRLAATMRSRRAVSLSACVSAGDESEASPRAARCAATYDARSWAGGDGIGGVAAGGDGRASAGGAGAAARGCSTVAGAGDGVRCVITGGDAGAGFAGCGGRFRGAGTRAGAGCDCTLGAGGGDATTGGGDAGRGFALAIASLRGARSTARLVAWLPLACVSERRCGNSSHKSAACTRIDRTNVIRIVGIVTTSLRPRARIGPDFMAA